VYETTRDAQAIEFAIECLRKAVELYPTSATLRADLATALAAADRAGPAMQQARRALELDDQMPHADRKLSAELRERMQSLAAQAPGSPSPPR
jgi:predicted Zn-dependent protease